MARYSLFVLKVPLNANQPLSVRYCFWLHRFVRKMSVSQMWRWSGGRGIWTELSLCYSVVWHYNGAQWYQQFLQVGRLDPALILFGLALCFPSTSLSLVFMVLHYILYFYWMEPGGTGRWLTIVHQCYDTVGLVMW